VNRSYSKLLAFEASRILFRLGCDVRVFDPTDLPVKDDDQHQHPKVQELRDLSRWSDGHVWISPEQHGTLVSHSLHICTHRRFPLTRPDRRIQEPNRLDPTLRRIRTSNPRPHPRRRRSFRWISILQRGERAKDIGALDAHVCHSEPVLCTDGL
jgi:hypothetical protein